MAKFKLIRESVVKTHFIEPRKVYAVITKKGYKNNAFVDEIGKWWIYDVVKSTYRPVSEYSEHDTPEYFYREVEDYDDEVKALIVRLNNGVVFDENQKLSNFKNNIKEIYNKIIK